MWAARIPRCGRLPRKPCGASPVPTRTRSWPGCACRCSCPTSRYSAADAIGERDPSSVLTLAVSALALKETTLPVRAKSRQYTRQMVSRRADPGSDLASRGRRRFERETSGTSQKARSPRLERCSLTALILLFVPLLIASTGTRVCVPRAPVAADAEAAKPKPTPEAALRGDARLTGFIATPFSANQGGGLIGFGLAAKCGARSASRSPLRYRCAMTGFSGDSTSRVAVQIGDATVPVRSNARRSELFFRCFLAASADRLAGEAVPQRLRRHQCCKLATRCPFRTRAPAQVRFPTTIGRAASSGGAGLDIGSVASYSLNATLGFRRLTGAVASFSRAS